MAKPRPRSTHTTLQLFRPGRRRLLSGHCHHPDPDLGKTSIKHDHGYESTALPFWVQLVLVMGMLSQVHLGHEEHPGEQQSERKSSQKNGHEGKEKGAEDRKRGREKGTSATKTEKDGRSKNGKRRKEEIRAIATTPSYSPNG